MPTEPERLVLALTLITAFVLGPWLILLALWWRRDRHRRRRPTTSAQAKPYDHEIRYDARLAKATFPGDGVMLWVPADHTVYARAEAHRLNSIERSHALVGGRLRYVAHRTQGDIERVRERVPYRHPSA